MRDTLRRWRQEAGLSKELPDGATRLGPRVEWTGHPTARSGVARLQRPCLLRLAHALPDGVEPGVVYRHRPQLQH